VDSQRFEELKEKMTSEKVLSAIMVYFLDHFGEVPGFSAMGRPTQHKIVESFLEKALLSWHQAKLLPNSVRLIEIPEHHFIHGVCMFEGGMMNVLYFDDIQTGIIVSAGNRTRPSQLMRFSVKEKPPSFASRN